MSEPHIYDRVLCYNVTKVCLVSEGADSFRRVTVNTPVPLLVRISHSFQRITALSMHYFDIIYYFQYYEVVYWCNRTSSCDMST